MRILAIDTSTFVGSVAVVVDGELLCELTARVRASHGEAILVRIDQALTASKLAVGELDLVAYARGPGSFTGVRIALATAKGLALATGVATLGVSSLRVLAEPLAVTRAIVCPVIDARKHEVYTTAIWFGADGETVLLPECVAAPAEAGRCLRQVGGSRELMIVGEGARAYSDELLAAIGTPVCIAPAPHEVPRASNLARIAVRAFLAGAREDPATAGPAYLRPPDAEYKPRV